MMQCPDCGKAMWSVEYRMTPSDYDGVSEWYCRGEGGCGLRIGRWSGVRLAEGEIEGRYGCGSPLIFTPAPHPETEGQ